MRINSTYWSGLHLKDKKNYQFGITFDDTSVLIHHANFTRVHEPTAIGTFVCGRGLDEFGLKFTFVSHTEGASLFDISNSRAKDMIFQYAVFKVVSSSKGIIHLKDTKVPMKCRDFVYIRCIGYMFPNENTENYIVDNCYIQQLPNVIDDDSSKGLNAALKAFENLQVAMPNFNVSYPSDINWDTIQKLDKAMITPTKQFTPSVTFLPTKSFTPSCTLSGILFIRKNKRWYSFRKSVKTVVVANSGPILKEYFDVL